jgi:hypothetical protein
MIYAVVDRFWKKVLKPADSSCWLWRGATNHNGYGVFRLESGATELAHRHSYKLAHPHTTITKGMLRCVMHSCDNRRCVNPDHLKPGTPKRNAQDMKRKGRQIKPGGKAHGNAKLTWSIIRNIRRNYQGKWGERVALCKQYNVGKATMRDILSGRSWKETQGE